MFWLLDWTIVIDKFITGYWLGATPCKALHRSQSKELRWQETKQSGKFRRLLSYWLGSRSELLFFGDRFLEAIRIGFYGSIAYISFSGMQRPSQLGMLEFTTDS